MKNIKISKNRKKIINDIPQKKEFSIKEAIAILKKTSYAKFDESIDIAVNLNIDPKKSEQIIRSTLVLPNGNGVKKRILAICNFGDEDKCIKNGADFAGSDDIIKKIEEGWTDFDVIVTIPSMMFKLGKLGKILGPKGLMPNPKTGGITQDIEKTLTEIKKGRIEIKNDEYGILHNCIGKKSFDADKLEENFHSYIHSLNKIKPTSVKGEFIKKVSLSSTMGVGLVIKL